MGAKLWAETRFDGGEEGVVGDAGADDVEDDVFSGRRHGEGREALKVGSLICTYTGRLSKL